MKQSNKLGTTKNKKILRPQTIKAWVFHYVHRNKGLIDCSELTKEIRKHFPKSKWNHKHWTWYKYQILKGKFKKDFSTEERRNIKRASSPSEPIIFAQNIFHDESKPQRGPAPKDPEVKRLGDNILRHIRFVINTASGDYDDLKFNLNRWIYTRLQKDESDIKKPIKEKLWKSGKQVCQSCGEKFSSLKGVELHRKNPDKSYTFKNCELLCRECHQELNNNGENLRPDE